MVVMVVVEMEVGSRYVAKVDPRIDPDQKTLDPDPIPLADRLSIRDQCDPPSHEQIGY